MHAHSASALPLVPQIQASCLNNDYWNRWTKSDSGGAYAPDATPLPLIMGLHIVVEFKMLLQPYLWHRLFSSNFLLWLNYKFHTQCFLNAFKNKNKSWQHEYRLHVDQVKSPHSFDCSWRQNNFQRTKYFR